MTTHRERVLTAFSHHDPDRVPVDIAGTGATQINFDAYERLKSHLGIELPPGPMYSTRSHLAIIDEEVLRELDVDCRGIRPPGPVNNPSETLPDGSLRDEWGAIWAKPRQGHYYVKQPVFTGDLTIDAITGHNWPDPEDPGYVQGLEDTARALHEGTDYFVILNLPVGFGHQCQFVRGYDNWLMDLAVDTRMGEALADAVLDIWMTMSRRMLQACGPYIDGVFYADDIAFQHGPMMRHNAFAAYFKPRFKRIFDMIRAETGAKLIFHSCGSVISVLPDLIEIGIDALNPVQVSATDMDAARLKKEYGRDITFWGAIDTQRVLPFGTPDEVRQEVRQRVAELGSGGGYVLASVHNFQAEIPPENIVAMVETARNR